MYWHKFLKNVHHPYLGFFLGRADDSSQLGWNLCNEWSTSLREFIKKKISVSYLKVCECNDELMCGVSWPEILVALLKGHTKVLKAQWQEEDYLYILRCAALPTHLLGHPLPPLPLSMLISKCFLLAEFKGRTVNYGTIFFPGSDS